MKLTQEDLFRHLHHLAPERKHFLAKYILGVKDPTEVLDAVVVLQLLVADWLAGHTKLSPDATQQILSEFKFRTVVIDRDGVYHLSIHDWRYVALTNVHDRFYDLVSFDWVDSLPHPSVTIMACDLRVLLVSLENHYARVPDPDRRAVPGDVQAPTEP